MKFSDLTLSNLILVILIFILVLGLASYSLNRHDKFKEIFEENSSAEDENVLKVIAPVPVEEASKDSIQDRLRSWFSVEENEDSEIVKYFLIGLGIVLILVGLISLIYFCLRNHVMDVEMLIISKKEKKTKTEEWQWLPVQIWRKRWHCDRGQMQVLVFKIVNLKEYKY